MYAISANPTKPPNAIGSGRSLFPKVAKIIAAKATPTTSCITDQPSIASSVMVSVFRRGLRVIFTITTLDDIAIDNERSNAPSSGTSK